MELTHIAQFYLIFLYQTFFAYLCMTVNLFLASTVCCLLVLLS